MRSNTEQREIKRKESSGKGKMAKYNPIASQSLKIHTFQVSSISFL